MLIEMSDVYSSRNSQLNVGDLIKNLLASTVTDIKSIVLKYSITRDLRSTALLCRGEERRIWVGLHRRLYPGVARH